jgi:uncharacterized membrane protein YgcG
MISLILILGVPAALIILFILIKKSRGGKNYNGVTPLDSGFQSGTGAEETASNNFDGFGGGEFGGGGAEGSWSDSSDSGSSDSGGDGGGGDGGGGD